MEARLKKAGSCACIGMSGTLVHTGNWHCNEKSCGRLKEPDSVPGVPP